LALEPANLGPPNAEDQPDAGSQEQRTHAAYTTASAPGDESRRPRVTSLGGC
jgi:hypothetical protein